MAYATVAEVLQRMGHADAPSLDLSAKITDALDAATTAIDNDTSRSFAPLGTVESPVARTFAAPRSGYRLWLPDLVSVSSVKFDTGDDGLFATTVAATDYELDTFHDTHAGWPFEFMNLLSGSWPCGRRRRNVQITGVWGWSAVPDPINQAATLLAVRTAQRPSAAPFGLEAFSDGGGGYVRTNDPDYMHMIGPYVKVGIA